MKNFLIQNGGKKVFFPFKFSVIFRNDIRFYNKCKKISRKTIKFEDMLSVLDARCEDDEPQYTLIITTDFPEDNKKQIN